jgi:linoleate 10R-lipoxygenase
MDLSRSSSPHFPLPLPFCSHLHVPSVHSDDDIVRTLTEATDTIAGAFGAKNVPAVMKVIDCLGMRIARTDWNCASLNEFREFLGLTKLKSFKEWNSDPVVAENARRLYKDVDNLELMPGLACEEAKPSMEGSGLCPGYTISRAILSDATALVRGDRYVRLSFSLFFSLPVADLSLFFQLTTDYNAGNLTSFQWKDVQPDLENGAFGGSVGKVRRLPPLPPVCCV